MMKGTGGRYLRTITTAVCLAATAGVAAGRPSEDPWVASDIEQREGFVSHRVNPPCDRGVHFVFASEVQSRNLLGVRDDFMREVSATDRRLRMRTTDPVALDTFLAFNRDHARSWAEEEIAVWRPVVADLNAAMATLDTPIRRIVIAKASGEQELDASAYTRRRTIFLREDLAWLPGQNPRVAFFLLAHETFHIISRYDPHLRDELYALIGFERFVDFYRRFAYPAELEASRLTNPDGVDYHHAITVDTPSGAAAVLPIAQLNVSLAQAILLPDPFRAIAPKLLAIDLDSGRAIRDAQGVPVLYSFAETDYVERAQLNTGFIIQPDEILADNFATLVEGLAIGQLRPANPSGFPLNDVALVEAIQEVLASGCR